MEPLAPEPEAVGRIYELRRDVRALASLPNTPYRAVAKAWKNADEIVDSRRAAARPWLARYDELASR